MTARIEVTVPALPSFAGDPARACAGEDPATFFPENEAAAVTAKAICWTCPFRKECLTHALTAPEEYGVWGGMTERERKVVLEWQRRKGKQGK